jgi:2-polyprenyl-3-methyl-5-hydroxy-6-metoxy-1,4-benzoquinol methylase
VCACEKKQHNVSNQKIFTQIYQKSLWGKNSHGEGCSGDGSSLVNATPYMNFLQTFMQEHDIKSVVDVGCGDWEFSKHMDWTGITYIGIDVVPTVVKKNNALYKNKKCSFICKDVTKKSLPKGDLLICKDVLQHLTTQDIKAVCRQFQKFKYCLITNDIDNTSSVVKLNDDLPVLGGLRELDLTLEPFNITAEKVFSYTVPTGPDGCITSTKQVLLITRSLP